jgi:protocatechuate 3,4-dioxygenase beta subunit
MQRRKFLRDTGMVAIGVGVFGSIRWSNNRFVGDTPTTTDILGPFYRPNAPFRVNINSPEYSGKPFHLSGTVFREDGKSPFQNCLVEIWQCDENKVYDNTSDDFKYRGSQKTDRKGRYHFITTHPLPYAMDSKGQYMRPAHIHMRLSGEKQQDLVTQIYFTGDPYLEEDSRSKSPTAVNRILAVSKNNKDEEMVQFDIVMANEFRPSDNFFETIVGIYEMNNKEMWEYNREGDLLFIKRNGQYVIAASYKGNNEFDTAGGSCRFEIHANGLVTVCQIYGTKSKECNLTGKKVFKY